MRKLWLWKCHWYRSCRRYSKESGRQRERKNTQKGFWKWSIKYWKIHGIVSEYLSFGVVHVAPEKQREREKIRENFSFSFFEREKRELGCAFCSFRLVGLWIRRCFWIWEGGGEFVYVCFLILFFFLCLLLSFQ